MTESRRPDFNARAGVYDTLRPADRAWWGRFDALVELGDLRGRRILDIGCGTGRLAAALATQAHAKVWGVDESDRMVSAARSAVPPEVGIREGKAERLPFRAGWFDRATMSLVIHLVNRPAAFAEARRVVAADGRIAIATFHPAHFATYWLNPYFPSIRPIDEARFPAPDGLEAELRAAGFGRFEARRLVVDDVIDRETGLTRIRGRHISTFDLLPEDEIAEGLARAERELPAQINVRLDQLVAVGFNDQS